MSFSYPKMVLDVESFFTKMGFAWPRYPNVMPENLAVFRSACLREELQELNNAKSFDDVLDAVIDLSYFAVGTLLLLGESNQVFPQIEKRDNSRFMKSLIYSHLIGKTFDAMFIIDIIGFETHAQTNSNAAAAHLFKLLAYCEAILRSFDCNFHAHWSEVHRCNMLKEPATKENPSKRGRVDHDSNKPKDWAAPDHFSIYIGVSHVAV